MVSVLDSQRKFMGHRLSNCDFKDNNLGQVVNKNVPLSLPRCISGYLVVGSYERHVRLHLAIC